MIQTQKTASSAINAKINFQESVKYNGQQGSDKVASLPILILESNIKWL